MPEQVYSHKIHGKLSDGTQVILHPETDENEVVMNDGRSLAQNLADKQDATQVNGKVNEHNVSTTCHSDIRASIPTKTSQLTNDSNYATVSQIPNVSSKAETTYVDTQDTILQTNINNEATARQQADTNLQTQITDNSSKITVLSQQNIMADTIFKMNTGQAVTIACYGDSTTFGMGSSDSLLYSYPIVLQKYLRQIYKNNNITVINKGVSGRNSKDGIDNLQNDVISISPNMCIVMFGINDSREGATYIPINTYIQNMSNICTQLKNNNIGVVVASPIPIRYPHIERERAYVKAIESVALKFETHYIDLFSEVKRLIDRDCINNIEFFADSLHPKDRGYTAMASIFTHKIFGVNKLTEKMPLAYTDNEKTDCGVFVRDVCPYGIARQMVTSTTSHNYIQVPFFIDSRSANVNIHGIYFNSGASINVLVDGVIAKEINQLDSSLLPSNAMYKGELLCNVGYGFHIMEILKTNKTSTSGGMYFGVSHLSVS